MDENKEIQDEPVTEVTGDTAENIEAAGNNGTVAESAETVAAETAAEAAVITAEATETAAEAAETVTEAVGAAAPAAAVSEPSAPESPGPESPAEAADPAKAAKKKKRRIITAAVAAAVLIGAGSAYVVKANSYQNRFIKGTSINGNDVSELSCEQVEEMLKGQVADYALNVTFPDGSIQTLSSEALKISYTPDGSVQELMNSQNRFLWPGYLFGQNPALEVDTPLTYAEKDVVKAMKELPAFQKENITESVDAHMEFDDSHHVKVVAETYGTHLKDDAVKTKLIEALDGKSAEMTFDKADYIQPEILSDDKKLNDQIADLNGFLDTRIKLTLHDDSEYVIDAGKLKDWLSPDPDHEDWYIMDDEIFKAKAKEEAAALAEKDNVSNYTFTFKSSLCGNVNLRCPRYGCAIDEEAESEQIYQDVMARGEIDRKPTYAWQSDYPLGSSYIEIDIGHQQVFVYNKGKQVLHTYCVSGTDTDPSRRSDRGFFHVTWKTTDHVMKGPIQADGRPSYESHINYGVYYNGGEALHDASWRDSFGGSTYLYSGSHGCINLSNSAAATVYNNSWVGMPVIVFN